MPTKKATTQSPAAKKTAPQKSEATNKTAATPTNEKQTSSKKAAATTAPKNSKAAASSTAKPTSTKKPSTASTGSTTANKKAPSKTSATKKTTSRKTTASTTSGASKKSAGTTQIIAKADVGFGNTIFIRGEGAELSWEKGIPMANAGSDEWSWSTKKASSTLVFKFLINDETWSQGDNITVAPGDSAVTTPSF